MRIYGLSLGVLALMLCVPEMASAVEVAPGVKVGAHIRTRFIKHDGRDGDSSDNAFEYFENRVRLSLDVDTVEWLRAFSQLQDVRVWGEETNTLTDYSANGFDVHQAYGDFRLGSKNLVLRVGRQQIVVEEQRLVGAVGWTPSARSFDAARLFWDAPGGGLHIEGFYAQILEDESIAPGPATNTNTDFAMFSGIGAIHKHKLDNGSLSLSAWAFVDYSDAAERTRATIGLRHAGKLGMFRYRVEGYYQLGELKDETIGAFMAAVDVGVVLESAANLDIRLWADYLSGTDDPAKAGYETFNTLYATNHKFYGFADFFINIPVHTQGKGLIDLALKISAKPLKNLKISLDGHYFLPAEDQGGPSVFGSEVDFVVAWKPVPHVSTMLGVFAMIPDDGLKARIGGDDVDLGLYFALQGDL